MIMKKTWITVLSLFIVLVSGCMNPVPVENDYTGIQKALDAGKSRWASLGFQHYQFDYSFSGMALDAGNLYTIEVSDNTIVSVYDNSHDTWQNSSDFIRYRTVNDIFKLIQQSINEKACKIVVQYDPAAGYPSKVYIDRDEKVSDEETSLKAENLIRINGSY
jgi:hypothetical protein